MVNEIKNNAIGKNNSLTFIYLREFGINTIVMTTKRGVSWRDSHLFTSRFLFKKAWYFIPHSAINHSVLRIFIVPKMYFLSLDDVLLH